MKLTANHSKHQYKSHDHGGDSQSLSDRIYSATGVMAKVRLDSGQVTLTTRDLADYFIARSWLKERGFGDIARAL